MKKSDLEKIKSEDLIKSFGVCKGVKKFFIWSALCFNLIFLVKVKFSEVYFVYTIISGVAVLFLSLFFRFKENEAKNELLSRGIELNDLKDSSSKTRKRTIIILVCCVLAIFIFIAFLENTEYISDSMCQVCERTFTDSTNLRSIARTNMCKNCADNYNNMSQFIGQ